MRTFNSFAHMVLGSAAGALVLAGAFAVACPAPASAQVMRFTTSSRVDNSAGGINEVDVRSLVETLNLDGDQEALVKALYDGHRAAWNDATTAHKERVQAAFEASRASNDWTGMGKKTQQLQKQWEAESVRLETDFFASVKGLVSDDQMAAWPRFERDRRRRTLLASQSQLSGEGVDLIDVAEAIEIPHESLAQIQPVSSLYAEEMDSALTERSRAIESLEKASAPKTEGDFGSIDFEAVKEQQTRVHERRIAVRDLNGRYVALFCGRMSGDEAQQFMTLYKQRCFPRVYRPTAADRYIKTVESLETLTGEQSQALANIKSDYTRQVSGINDQLAAVIRQSEEESEDQGFFFGGDLAMLPPPPPPPPAASGVSGEEEHAVAMFVIAGDGGAVEGGAVHLAPEQTAFSFGPSEPEDDTPRGKLNKSKRELVARTIDAVAALLTPEQLALAPKPDQGQQLAPEERMRRQVEKALENAVIEATGEGGESITITLSPSSDDN
ncbi:MAG: hypothetical protein IT430_12360 [Phycisphaerales bacterium]|nr:hypothetical protein [Phycisphaerales bacterium]